MVAEEALPVGLAVRAAAGGARTCATFADGTSWTFLEADAAARSAAATLGEHGVRPGTRILLAVPDGPDWLRAWWGCSALRGAIVPIATHARGAALEHIVRSARAPLAIADPTGQARLRAAGFDAEVLEAAALREQRWRRPEARPEAQDVHTVCFTTDSEPLPHGVLVSWAQTAAAGRAVFGADVGLAADDLWLVDRPLGLVASQQIISAAVGVGAAFTIAAPMADADFWAGCRQLRVTRALVSARRARALLRLPAREEDRRHRLRTLVVVPMTEEAAGLAERFGVRSLITAYGTTATGAPIVAPDALRAPPGSCGRPRAGMEARVVDGAGTTVADGEVGELVLRAQRRAELASGHLEDGEVSCGAWRGGWWHTGDLFRVDADGWWSYLDRHGDALTCGGERVSSVLIEDAVAEHAEVRRCACVAVKGPAGDDARVFVVPDTGEPRLRDLLEHATRRLPHPMVPRYFDVVAELPRCAAGAVDKAALRARPLSDDTWDREEHGLSVTSEGLLIRVDHGLV